MTWQFSAYFYIYLLVGVVLLVTALMNWRHRHQPGMGALAQALFFILVWSVAALLEVMAVDVRRKIFFVTIEYAVAGIYTNLLLLFVLRYYHHARWLTGRRLVLFWAFPVIDTLAVVTNDWHSLVWTGVVPGASGSYELSYLHGPLWTMSMLYQAVVVGAAIAVIVYEAIRSRGWARLRSVWMAIVFALPFLLSYLLVLPDQTLGVSLLPIGFAVSGLLLSWMTFEDMYQQVISHRAELAIMVESQQKEIDIRRQLETQLRQNQEALSAQLSNLSRNLADLYHLILMAGQSLEPEEILRQAMNKVQNVLSSDAVCFYVMERDFLRLQVPRGLSPQQQAELQNLPIDWLFFGFEVRVDLNPAHTPDLPPAIGRAGFNATMFKWVPLPDKIPGVVGCFWQEPREFTVEDIALFSAFTDGLGIILENARLRQSVAQNAMVTERHRLARDLHDSVTQSLHSLVLTADMSNRQSNPETARKMRQLLVDSARQALKEMRLLLYDLQLASPQEIGLVTALQTRLEAVERRAGVEAQLAVDKNATWPKNWDDQLYPIAIEALNNALKHARATQISITLRGDTHHFKMCIADNGCGFAVPSQTNRGGMGLRNLTERAELLGGQLNIKSEAGQGTVVTVGIDRQRSVPVSPEV